MATLLSVVLAETEKNFALPERLTLGSCLLRALERHIKSDAQAHQLLGEMMKAKIPPSSRFESSTSTGTWAECLRENVIFYPLLAHIRAKRPKIVADEKDRYNV